MRYPIVITDFDDTLLRSDLTLSDYTKDVIKRYEEAGGTLIVCTGRMYTSVCNSVKRVGLKKGLVVSYQGAMINDMTDGSLLYHKTLDNDTAVQAIKMLEKEDCSIQIYIDDKLYIKKHTKHTLAYEKACEIKMTELNTILSDYIKENNCTVTKILAIISPERAKELYRQYPEFMGNKADFCMSKPYFFECLPKGATKGNAAYDICKMKNLTKSDIISFGDGNNDISMLEFADLSFAVENAQEDAKKAAKQICPSNDDDGVAKMIEKYCLNS